MHHGIAFARSLFEARTIENLDPSATIFDETGRLHCMQGKRHGFAVGAQQMRQELVGERQVLAVEAVVDGLGARFAQNRTLTGYPNDDCL